MALLSQILMSDLNPVLMNVYLLGRPQPQHILAHELEPAKYVAFPPNHEMETVVFLFMSFPSCPAFARASQAGLSSRPHLGARMSLPWCLQSVQTSVAQHSGPAVLATQKDVQAVCSVTVLVDD